MAISGASTQQAATPAASPSATNQVNLDVAVPASERYPGAVDAAQYLPGSYEVPGGPAGPPFGEYAAEPFTSSLPVLAPGGGYQDTAWMSGTDAPELAWDSSAGPAFAPSGALDPDLHGIDTGGVYVREYVVPAAIGSLTRATATGQTYDELANTRDTIGQNTPNGRQNQDQQQWHNPDGYDPWQIPYAERPIQNNVAWQNVPLDAVDSPYAVSGALSDRAPFDYAAVAYESPPDPSVATVPAQAPASIGGEWTL